MMYGPPTFGDWVTAAWAEAITVWGVSIELTIPQSWSANAQTDWEGPEPLAFVNLETRQVVCNYDRLSRMGLLWTVPAVFAHEIGHHIRFPHTLGLAAQLDLLLVKLLPDAPRVLLNLFFDLQVNEWVGQTHAPALQAVYRGFSEESPIDSSIFAFYLAVYEELWGLSAGSLGAHSKKLTMDATYEGWRGDARMFAQTFWALPDTPLQFIYFCSMFARYLAGHTATPQPMAGDVLQPDADDYANALNGSRAIDNAIDNAQQKGWLAVDKAAAARTEDGLSSLSKVLSKMPGQQAAAFRRAIVNRHYHHLVEQHLFKVPPQPNQTPPEAFIPSTTEDWEWGDSPSAIDWTSSIRASGALAAAMPLQRALLPDDSEQRGVWQPFIEIWLDTSGSMPDPQASVNAMTLAAQILAAAAIRKGGSVRAVVYSWGDPLISEWMQDEAVARDFLLNYAGGGTDYPFALFRDHAVSRKDAYHVVISDGDYLYNYRQNKANAAFLEALDFTKKYIALLQVGEWQARIELKELVAHSRFQLVIVPNFQAFAKMAADLADALFGDRR